MGSTITCVLFIVYSEPDAAHNYTHNRDCPSLLLTSCWGLPLPANINVKLMIPIVLLDTFSFAYCMHQIIWSQFVVSVVTLQWRRQERPLYASGYRPVHKVYILPEDSADSEHPFFSVLNLA